MILILKRANLASLITYSRLATEDISKIATAMAR